MTDEDRLIDRVPQPPDVPSRLAAQIASSSRSTGSRPSCAAASSSPTTAGRTTPNTRGTWR
ncbi:hypothetical protein [Actinomadura sp. CNU-125]|uniref:hypothetical protein n=1 Tax=Actinomadura sp. CNU-125 TaxID=1904961 RepID=UPI0021CC8BCF|nr:hypothetical protein [Actinomadura sp. CNU-125]